MTLTIRADDFYHGYNAGPPETEEYYYLTNKQAVNPEDSEDTDTADVFNTCGCVKLSLLFKKIKKNK